MTVRLNWKNCKLNSNSPLLRCWLAFTVLMFLFNSTIAQSKLSIKKKLIDGVNETYVKVGVGASYPCGERFGFSLEDTSRYIFSARSAFCATLLEINDTIIDFPGDGGGVNGKTIIEQEMTYGQSFERIRDLKVGYTDASIGKKWTLSSAQLKELYLPNTFDVNYNGKPRTAFSVDNIFYEMLVSIQILAKQNDEQQSLIEEQATAIERLNERLEHIENSLNIDAEIIPFKTLGEVTISPNPITNGNIQVAYQLNENAVNAVLKITDIQGKQVYEVPINANQKRGNQNLDIDLPAGSYLYYLENNAEQTLAKKLIIL